MMEEILIKIRDYADNAHGNQMRKYTQERYIVHPVRVMETLRGYTGRLPLLATALLHDVLEDTPVKAPEMLGFLKGVMNDTEAEETLNLVIEMTDVFVKEAYPELNRKQRKQLERGRIALTSANAQTIKYADVIDNAIDITTHDHNFAPHYLKEVLAILKVADKGNAQLYAKAMQVVTDSLNAIKFQ